MPGPLRFQYRLPPDLETLAQRFPKAANAVLNRTGNEARTRLGEYATEHFNIDGADIKKRISVVQSTWNSLTFYIRIKGRKIPMIDFLSGPKKATAQRGISPSMQQAPVVEIIRGKRTTLLDSPFPGQQKGGKAFVMKSKKQGFQIRRRSGEFDSKNKEHTTLWRYIHPIIIFKNPRVWDRTVAYVEQRLLKELPRVAKVFIETGKES